MGRIGIPLRRLFFAIVEWFEAKELKQSITEQIFQKIFQWDACMLLEEKHEITMILILFWQKAYNVNINWYTDCQTNRLIYGTRSGITQ